MHDYGLPDSEPAAVRLVDLFPLAEAADRLPRRRRGRKVHQAAPYRWAQRGIKGVRLRTALVGGILYTCEAWLWDFLNRERVDGLATAPAAATPAPPAAAAAAPIRTPAQERRALTRAMREAERRGLLRRGRDSSQFIPRGIR